MWKKFAIPVSISLILIMIAVPLTLVGIVLADPAIWKPGLGLLTVGGVGAIAMLVMLGSANEAS